MNHEYEKLSLGKSLLKLDEDKILLECLWWASGEDGDASSIE